MVVFSDRLRTGNSWNLITKGGPKTIFKIANDSIKPGTIFAAGSSLVNSLNRGKSWNYVENNLDEDGPYAIFDLKVHPHNPNFLAILLGNPDSVGISLDGGHTWNKTVKFNLFSLALDPMNENVIYIAVGKRIEKSSDFGQTWTAGKAFANSFITSLEVDPMNPNIIYAGTFRDRVYKTENGGETWILQSSGIPQGKQVSGIRITIAPTNSSVVFAASSLQGIFKSLDGGRNWSRKNNGIPLHGFFPRFLVADTGNSDVLFTVDGNNLFISQNAGEMWTRFPSTGLPLDYDFSPPQTSAIRALVTTDSGRTLLAVTKAGVFEYTLSSR